jgi:cytochrome c oxidase assembly protein subunit 15
MSASPRTVREGSAYHPVLHGLVLLTTALTWPLLLVGGSVTVYRVGMAVPDWPTTFGVNMFLYDFLNSPWGVQLEHTHRLLGAAVGLLCIAVAAGFLLKERRGWLKGLAVAALVAVIAQGVMGGFRVRWNSRDLAFVHGCTAEAFFALMVAFCVYAGRGWATTVEPAADDQRLRRKTMTVAALVFAQIVLGAWVRHYGDWRGVLVHGLFATTVLGHVLAVGVRVRRVAASVPSLLPSGRALVVLAVAQLVLGLAAWWLLRPFDGVARTVWPAQAAVRVMHQGLGALLLASAIVLALRARRALVSLPIPSPPDRSAADRHPLEVLA